jgi:hypothetical protein
MIALQIGLKDHVFCIICDCRPCILKKEIEDPTVMKSERSYFHDIDKLSRLNYGCPCDRCIFGFVAAAHGIELSTDRLHR